MSNKKESIVTVKRYDSPDVKIENVLGCMVDENNFLSIRTDNYITRIRLSEVSEYTITNYGKSRVNYDN